MVSLNEEQLAIIKFLYDQKDISFSADSLRKNGLNFKTEDLLDLKREKLISLWYLNDNESKCKISAQGRAWYENYLVEETKEKHKAIYEEAVLNEAKEANDIARKANQRAFASSIIAIVSVVVSLIALILDFTLS